MENPPPESEVSLDTSATLTFEYLKHLGTIALTAAGGLIALIQFSGKGGRFFTFAMIAVGMLFLSALFSFLVQLSLIDRLRQGHAFLRTNNSLRHMDPSVRKAEKLFESLALWLLALAFGVALYALAKSGAAA